MVSPFILGRSAQGVGLRVLGVRNKSVGICYGDPSTVHSSSCVFFWGGGGGGVGGGGAKNRYSISIHITGHWSNWAQFG